MKLMHNVHKQGKNPVIPRFPVDKRRSLDAERQKLSTPVDECVDNKFSSRLVAFYLYSVV